jgi:hypothetical protein
MFFMVQEKPLPANPLLSAALDYAALGYPVFPCVPGGKKPPKGSHGFKDATMDPNQIRRWWTTTPAANIGLSTQGLVTVDIDGADNPWRGGAGLDAGPMSITPRGGVHLIFSQPAGHDWRNTESQLAPKVDTRANGGYIVASPSTVGERAYRWERPLCRRKDLPEPPQWLIEQLDALEKPKASTPPPNSNGSHRAGLPPYIQKALDSELGRVALAAVGERNAVLNRAAFALGQFVGAGVLERAYAEERLTEAAQRCGLDVREIASTIRSGIDAGIKQPRQTTGNGAGPRPMPKMRSLAPTTPTTAREPPESSGDDEHVGGEGVQTGGKPQFTWEECRGLSLNAEELGSLLAELPLGLYRYRDHLLRIRGGRATQINSSKELIPLLIDSVEMQVTKQGIFKREMPAHSVINDVLKSETFLGNFERVEEVIASPLVLLDFYPTLPGYNPASKILYIGGAVETRGGLDNINRFLDHVPFASNADRTNAVAALMTVLFRFHWCGNKPLILLMATQSHSGKGCLVKFCTGGMEKVAIQYQSTDWPMATHLYGQLKIKPSAGVIDIDNVRTDTAGRGSSVIKSALFESMITSSEVILSSVSSKNEPLQFPNRFVIFMNTNHGSLSIDLLNRSLPIRLTPTDDVDDRNKRAEKDLGHGLKEWLETKQRDIAAEAWGMITRWREEGCPLEKGANHHPMRDWAETIGAIVKVNGFEDFLGNYAEVRQVSNPETEALGIVALHAFQKPLRPDDNPLKPLEVARIVVEQDLERVLLPQVNLSKDVAMQRVMGKVLSAHENQLVRARTEKEQLTFRVRKGSKRLDKHPTTCYWFPLESRQTIKG